MASLKEDDVVFAVPWFLTVQETVNGWATWTVAGAETAETTRSGRAVAKTTRASNASNAARGRLDDRGRRPVCCARALHRFDRRDWFCAIADAPSIGLMEPGCEKTTELPA